MSNRATVPQTEKKPANVVEVTAAEPAKKEKKSIIQRLVHVKDKITATKVGRISLGLGKAAAAGGALYLSFRAGAKSVKPTTVYIREGATEEEEPEEPTETIDQETGEIIEE